MKNAFDAVTTSVAGVMEIEIVAAVNSVNSERGINENGGHEVLGLSSTRESCATLGTLSVSCFWCEVG